MCSEEVLSWKRIANPWNESIHARRSLVRELRDGCCRYSFKVVHRPGKTNIADALSRLNSMKQLDCGEEYDFIRAVVESCVPVVLLPKKIDGCLTMTRNCA